MVEASDEMIEIGDPEIEPAVPEPTHQVVIQYRDRGVPWMLLPALLMLSAIVTIYAYRKLQPPALRPTSPPPVAVAVVEPKEEPVVSAKPVEPVALPVVEPTPMPTPTPPAVEQVLPPVVEATPPADDPKPAPRVQGLGFDPNAFQADPRVADPAVNAVSQDLPRVDPAPARVVDPSTLPVEVDPDDLPPDPRKAKQMRASRAVEAKKRADLERVKFHADLRAILRQAGDQAGDAIENLCDQYGTDVDPAATQKAMERLGKTGAYAGVSRPVRINLLRSLGYPEARILVDLYEQVTRLDPPESRSGWKSKRDALVYVATILVNNPPARPPTTPKATVTAQPNPPASNARRPGSMLLRDNPGR